jgi:hypothetical protein
VNLDTDSFLLKETDINYCSMAPNSSILLKYTVHDGPRSLIELTAAYNVSPVNRFYKIYFHTLASDKISGTPAQVLREMANNINNTNDIKYKSNNTKPREKQ